MKPEKCEDLLVFNQATKMRTHAGSPGRQGPWTPSPSPSPRGGTNPGSDLCQPDTWQHARRYLGSWVMRLGLLGAFNYQSNVQTHFSLETLTQAQSLFPRKSKLLPPPGREDIAPEWYLSPIGEIHPATAMTPAHSCSLTQESTRLSLHWCLLGDCPLTSSLFCLCDGLNDYI